MYALKTKRIHTHGTSGNKAMIHYKKMDQDGFNARNSNIAAKLPVLIQLLNIQ